MICFEPTAGAFRCLVTSNRYKERKHFRDTKKRTKNSPHFVGISELHIFDLRNILVQQRLSQQAPSDHTFSVLIPELGCWPITYQCLIDKL